MAANELFIREAGPEDLELVRKIGRETYIDHFSDIWSPPAMERFMAQDFSRDALSTSLAATGANQWCLAFDADDHVVGVTRVNWSRPDPVDGDVGAELQKIYFRAAAVGKGYGGKLLAHVIEQATRRGEAMIWLDVLMSNIAAQRFYRRQGFVNIGKIAFDTDKGEIGMQVMKRSLIPSRALPRVTPI